MANQTTTLKHTSGAGIPAPVRIAVGRFGLVAEAGPDGGKMLLPLGEHTLVGREGWCDLVLADAHVSGEHFELLVQPDGVRLKDLGSTNGTYLGDVRVLEAVIPPGTGIRVGDTVLRLVQEQGLESLERQPYDATGTLIGTCPPMQRLFSMMRRIAPRDLSVLLLGETGTGKTAVANAMHSMSPRGARPFVAVNCAALPEHLVESTLFGHVRGAYTDAHRSVNGVFAQAQGGSVLLDEIGEMPPALQAKLLSVLETRSVRPLGGDRDIPVDFRLFTATNRRLAVEVAEGRFRQDLYYRIAGIELTVPALRDRVSDIPLLARWFVQRTAAAMTNGTGIPCLTRAISNEACARLAMHAWPGNVRELQNVLQRAVALAEGAEIQADEILLAATDFDAEPRLLGSAGCVAEGSAVSPAGSGDSGSFAVGAPVESFKSFKSSLLQQHESTYFRQLMAASGGNVSRAAQLAGISRTYLHTMIKKYAL